MMRVKKVSQAGLFWAFGIMVSRRR